MSSDPAASRPPPHDTTAAAAAAAAARLSLDFPQLVAYTYTPAAHLKQQTATQALRAIDAQLEVQEADGESLDDLAALLQGADVRSIREFHAAVPRGGSASAARGGGGMEAGVGSAADRVGGAAEDLAASAEAVLAAVERACSRPAAATMTELGGEALAELLARTRYGHGAGNALLPPFSGVPGAAFGGGGDGGASGGPTRPGTRGVLGMGATAPDSGKRLRGPIEL
jgi:hypothetical protein